MNLHTATEILSKLFRSPVSIQDGNLVARMELEGETHVFATPVAEMEQLLEQFCNLNRVSETSLIYDNTYEVMTDVPGFRPSGILARDGSIEKSDSENGLTYSFGEPSPLYLLFLVAQIQSIDPKVLRRIPIGIRLRRSLRDSQGETLSLFRLMLAHLPRFETVQIKSNNYHSPQEFITFLNSFLFNLGYNQDVPVVPVRLLEEYLRLTRIARMRRSSLDEMEPPRRHYVADLVSHYQQALASENPAYQYLSYYHIFEHFFEKVYTEELIFKVRDHITRPGFSTKRDADISSIIKTVSKMVKDRDEEYSFSEQDALLLTLRKYIQNKDSVIHNIREYDPDLLLRYQSQPVLFSGGDVIPFNSPDIDSIVAALARRIYKTRNSIVHSKDGNKARYSPFKDEGELLREIPLMRFLSEEIILATSVPL